MNDLLRVLTVLIVFILLNVLAAVVPTDHVGRILTLLLAYLLGVGNFAAVLAIRWRR